MFSVIVPFSGFYYSIHEEYINTVIESRDIDYSDIDFNKVYVEYCQEYLKNLSPFLDISLEFEELVCPREYNFITDRIFAKVSRSDLAKMLRKVRGERLNNMVREMFTSRPGFISYYSNCISDWGRIKDWDHNQIGAVLAAYYQKEKDGLGLDIEMDTAEEIYTNGILENIICDSSISVTRDLVFS